MSRLVTLEGPNANWEDEMLEWASGVENQGVIDENEDGANENGLSNDGGGLEDTVLGDGLYQVEFNYENIDPTQYPSDELESLYSSSDEDDEVIMPHAPIIKRSIGSKLIEVGKKFESAAKFRKALRADAIAEKYDFRFIKNEGTRVTAHCSVQCGWKIRASINSSDGSFQIKTINGAHNCSYTKLNRQASTDFLANRYMETLRDEPRWKPSAMRNAALRDCNVIVSKYKVYRARKKAKAHIEGDHGLQFSRARDYCRLIKVSNPGSIAVTRMQDRPTEEEPARFERLFICYDAMKRGFLEGCRPFIGLDGCFLKGPYKGQLLSAVGRDGDNGLFPIAVAVVRAETKDSWKWFLEQLENALGPLQRFTFMSDRQKGLVECFDDFLHGTNHRFCMKHMYDNFKKLHKGVRLRNEMWDAARALTEDKFNYHMQVIKNMDKDAYVWLAKVPPMLWSRHKFDDNSKCDLLVNNICETWNDNIGDCRDKPLITCLEWIRGYFMFRNQTKREWIQTKKGLLCPTITKEFKKAMDDARHCSAKKSAPDIYEVYYKGVNDGVNLGTRECSCRAWDVTGIPCIHAIAAIVAERGDPETWVDACYHRETYLRSYTPIIFPMPLRQMRREVGTAPIYPPIVKPSIGRPNKARKKALDEVNKKTGKASRQSKNFSCGKCGVPRHNSRTCKATDEEIKQYKMSKVTASVGGRPRMPVPSGLPGGLTDSTGAISSSTQVENASGIGPPTNAASGLRVEARTRRDASRNEMQLQQVMNLQSRYGGILNSLSESSNVDLNLLWNSQASSSSGLNRF